MNPSDQNKHSPSCKALHDKWLKDKKEYEEKWPGYCRKCGGWGGHYYTFDPSPAGLSLAPGTMTDYDLCSYCLENGICPRCGKATLDEDGNICATCGWNSEMSGIMEEPECWCELERFYAADDLDIPSDADWWDPIP